MFLGESKVPVKVLLLHVEGSKVPISIESCLAYGHDARLTYELFDDRPIA